MPEFDPYRVTAGPHLDTLVHTRIMGRSASDACPSYSNSKEAADLVKTAIETKLGASIVCGETNLVGKSWFARAEAESFRATEVLAESYPLAICSLALVLEAEAKPEPSGMGTGSFESESSSSSDQLIKSYAAARLKKGDLRFEMPESTRRILNSAVAQTFSKASSPSPEVRSWWHLPLPRFALAISSVILLIFAISLWHHGERRIEVAQKSELAQDAEHNQSNDKPADQPIKTPQGHDEMELLTTQNHQPTHTPNTKENTNSQQESLQNRPVLLSRSYSETETNETMRRHGQASLPSLSKQQKDEPSEPKSEIAATDLGLQVKDQLNENSEVASLSSRDAYQLQQERNLSVSLAGQAETAQVLTLNEQSNTGSKLRAIQVNEIKNIAQFSEANIDAGNATGGVTRTADLREVPPSRPLYSAPAIQTGPSTATAKLEYTPAITSGITLQFSRPDDRAKYRRNFNSPPPPNILSNFEVRIAGSEMIIIDSDESVYRGRLEDAASVDERRFSTLRLGTESNTIVPFIANGTNLSLKQTVVFSGNLFLKPADELTSELDAGSLHERPTIPDSESKALKAGRVIEGRALIGRDEIRIEAVESSAKN